MSVIKDTLDAKGGAAAGLEDQEALLDELMDIVASIDCARDLHQIGGLLTLLALLASPHGSLRWRAAEVVATCVQVSYLLIWSITYQLASLYFSLLVCLLVYMFVCYFKFVTWWWPPACVQLNSCYPCFASLCRTANQSAGAAVVLCQSHTMFIRVVPDAAEQPAGAAVVHGWGRHAALDRPVGRRRRHLPHQSSPGAVGHGAALQPWPSESSPQRRRCKVDGAAGPC